VSGDDKAWKAQNAELGLRMQNFMPGGQFANLVPNTTPPKRPKGIPRVSALLLKRIAETKGTPHEIPDTALSLQAVYDRVLVWQLPDEEHGGETYHGTSIVKPDAVRERIWQSVPRGLVVSMGLGAMDALRANGIDVGHVVFFCVNSPYRLPLDDHDQKHLCLLRAGDIVGSEDLARALDDNEVRIEEKDGEHVLLDVDGKVWKPRLPWMEE
jgi:hypothetical protein